MSAAAGSDNGGAHGVARGAALRAYARWHEHR